MGGRNAVFLRRGLGGVGVLRKIREVIKGAREFKKDSGGAGFGNFGL